MLRTEIGNSHVSKVQRFEDLIAWQKARALTRLVYQFTRKAEISKDFGFCNQIQRASVSTMSNIAEGFERGRRKEFHQALSTAKASCAEVRSLLYVASDTGYLNTTDFQNLLNLAEEVSRIVGGLRAAVARQIGNEKPTRTSRCSPPQSSALSPQSNP